ncbi:MAG: cytochrome b [Pseudomonadota bacterium]
MIKYMTGVATNLMAWVDARLPVTEAYRKHMSEYYAPKNFNFWYYFGVLSMVVLANQMLTGIWLTMFYTPSEPFSSIEYIMRDVEYGWLIRYMHSVGASAFFLVIYLHMFRALLYGSYKAPRELVWIFGVLIYVALMAEGFMGYVLPWGNMSYWGAQVIISLFGAIPYIGEDLTVWIRGDYLLSGASLNRFFALHVVAIPIVLLALVVLHILALHEVGSNNPDGVEIKKKKNAQGIPLDGIAFHPYYSVKDTVGTIVFLIGFAIVIFYFPTGGGYLIESPNFEPADPLKTPLHIAPVWYYGAYYAMLRAIPHKLSGVIVMFAAIGILFVLPWLDRNPIKSIRYKGMLTKVAMMLFAAVFLMLTWLGTQPTSDLYTMLARFGTAYYFIFFISLLFIHKFESAKPVPDRVTG